MSPPHFTVSTPVQGEGCSLCTIKKERRLRQAACIHTPLGSQVVSTGYKALHVGREVSFRLEPRDQGVVMAVDVRDVLGKRLANGLLAAGENYKGMRDYNEDRCV